ncbi:hypothetical protein ACKVMT_07235 [Halobacteriales archaeon Cl-PHB]
MTDESPSPREDPECAYCGDQVDLQTWTPTVVVETDDTPTILRFCDDECREAWRDQQ